MWCFEPDGFESQFEEPAASDGGSLFFATVGDELVAILDNGIPRPVTRDEFRWSGLDSRATLFLGTYLGKPCFAVEAAGTLADPFQLVPLRHWLEKVDSGLFHLAGRSRQIIDWHRDHAHCGRCGAGMRHHQADRSKRCPGCGLVCYPRLSPSVIVLVRRGDEMLLARNARWPAGMYSALAGFVEPGESIEQTVHREVREEVGIEVSALQYLGSQPWPFPNSLMLGFHAEYRRGEIVCIDEEIAEAHWFRYDCLPNIPERTAISRWLIDAFVKDRQGLRQQGS